MDQVQTGGNENYIKQRKGIDAATLKIIALISMTVFSIGNSIIDRLYAQKVLPQGNTGLFIYYGFIILGVPSFVLFTFLMTESFEHTSSRKSYLIRLFAAAVLSELPFDLFYSGTGNMLLQNVIFSYIAAFLTLCGIDAILGKYGKSDAEQHGMSKAVMILLVILTALAGVIVSEVIRGFYGCMIVALAVVFYFFKKKKIAIVIGGMLAFISGYLISDVLSFSLSRISEIKLYHLVKVSFTFTDFLNRLAGQYMSSLMISGGAFLGLILLLFYNGKKGYPQPKIFYYIYFPVHMLILIFVYFLLALVLGLGWR